MYTQSPFPGLLTLPSNRFAFGACTAVAHQPGRIYNPLWIYGPTGTGKTTLLHSLLLQIRERNPAARIRYVQAEDFLRSHINAIAGGYCPEFRTELAQLDVLVLDHVNILERAEFTQLSVGKLLAEVASGGCQVILASTRNPRQIRTLARTLERRCEFGLRVDISLPTAQERLAITRTFARELEVPLTKSLAPRIAFAGRSPSRIRFLLTHLSARLRLLGQEAGDLGEVLDQLLAKEVPV